MAPGEPKPQPKDLQIPASINYAMEALDVSHLKSNVLSVSHTEKRDVHMARFQQRDYQRAAEGSIPEIAYVNLNVHPNKQLVKIIRKNEDHHLTLSWDMSEQAPSLIKIALFSPKGELTVSNGETLAAAQVDVAKLLTANIEKGPDGIIPPGSINPSLKQLATS